MLWGFCLASFGVMFCRLVLCFLYTPKTTGPSSQWYQFFNCGWVWVWPCTSSLWGSIMYKIRCNPTHPLCGALSLWSVCRCGLHAALWLHIGSLMRLLAAEPRCIAGLLFPCQYLCGTIWVTPCSMVWDWQVSRAGPMPFYWPSARSLLVSCCFPWYMSRNSGRVHMYIK